MRIGIELKLSGVLGRCVCGGCVGSVEGCVLGLSKMSKTVCNYFNVGKRIGTWWFLFV